MGGEKCRCVWERKGERGGVSYHRHDTIGACCLVTPGTRLLRSMIDMGLAGYEILLLLDMSLAS